MERREALRLTASLIGTSIFGAQFFLSGCTSPHAQTDLLDTSDIPLLNTLADVILPKTTKSPGAKQANVGTFIFSIVKDCYSEVEAEVFNKGIKKLKTDIRRSYKKTFMELDIEVQNQVLTDYDQEAKEFEKRDEPHFYSMILQLTIWGYFISEPGATKALRYNPIPGRFEGCVSYSKKESAWA